MFNVIKCIEIYLAAQNNYEKYETCSLIKMRMKLNIFVKVRLFTATSVKIINYVKMRRNYIDCIQLVMDDQSEMS